MNNEIPSTFLIEFSTDLEEDFKKSSFYHQRIPRIKNDIDHKLYKEIVTDLRLNLFIDLQNLLVTLSGVMFDNMMNNSQYRITYDFLDIP